MKGSEFFVSLQTGVVLTEEYNVMVNTEELIGIARLVFRWFIPVVRAYKYIGKWVCTSNTTIFIEVY